MRLRLSLLCILTCGLPGCERWRSAPAPSAERPAATTGSTQRGSSKPAWFVDVARESGIDFVHSSGADGQYQAPEILGSGVAWLDHDLDGDLDVYLLSAGRDPERARNRLFENQGDGTFRDVTEHSGVGHTGFGVGCAVGDYDLDGDPDLYITNFGPNALYRNEGDGSFRDVTTAAQVADPRWGTAAIFEDIDRDGDLDLFVINYMQHPPHSPKDCPDALGRPEYCGPNGHFPPDRDTLYQNQGDGTFREITREAGMADARGYGLGVVSGDFDGDGHVDFYVANDETPNRLWLGDSRGHFVDHGVLRGIAFNAHGNVEASMGVQSEDVDGDGLFDVFVTHLGTETNTLYRGEPGGFFEDITYRSGLGPPSLKRTGFGTALFDADHDGDLDLIIANGRVRRGYLHDPARSPHDPARARAEGRESLDAGDLSPAWDLYADLDQFFEHVSAEEGGKDGPRGFRFQDRSAEAGATFRSRHVGRALAVADYDSDGDLDVLITRLGGRPLLLRNDFPKRGRWLMVRALEKEGAGYVYGAKVTVEAGGKRWVRRVQPAYSYLASNDPRLHFGLGEVTDARVEVEWPDGTKTARGSVPVDQVLTLLRQTGRNDQ